MKAVLDTNVWLDWLVFDDPLVRGLREDVGAGRVQLVASTRGRDELADVIVRPAVVLQGAAARARRGLPPLEAPEALAAFDRLVLRQEPSRACELVCSDPDDQCFLDLAVSIDARLLITKDRALLRLARGARARFGLTIVAPARLPRAADL